MENLVRPDRVTHANPWRIVHVVAAEALSPQMRRITLHADTLRDFRSGAPDDHVKLFIPPPGGATQPVVLLDAADPARPQGSDPARTRDYTPRWFDPARGEIVIDFALHGSGPATEWAAQATPGQWIGVAGPRSSPPLPDGRDPLLLAGDETALPAIGRILAEAEPGRAVDALIEVADAGEKIHLPTAANARIRWLHRDGASAGEPGILLEALRHLHLPTGDIVAWLAGEIETVRSMRRHLIEDEAVPRARIRAAGYWRRGVAGGHGRVDDDDRNARAAPDQPRVHAGLV